MMILFIPWDVWFTQHEIWQFNPKYYLGYKVLNLPVEEWLFFVFVPFACVFIYEVLNYFFPTKKNYSFSRYIILVIALFLLFIALLNLDKHYTSICFILTALFLIFTFYKNPAWSFKFLRMYVVSLIPFILINGFLTGSFTSEPVVIYHPDNILGIRILNIPIEDTIYNLLMLILVIYFYERK